MQTNPTQGCDDLFGATVVIVAYVLVFEPFGYRTPKDEGLLVAKIVLFPTAVLWAGVWVVARFIVGK
ncbi:hypothetical protein [Pseudophaeobacter arcticus]|uniref:hypothetical protein n=1 Tax=Pseudophaeobacter arcticus TaxID=385492 RepID=UPI00248F9B02|nr:hypothetical protein [Pseudophaeobacter arcticus]